MTARFVLIVLFVSMAPLGAAAQQLPSQVRVLRTGAVLQEPRGDADLVASVSPGEVLEVLDGRDGWYLVRPPQNPRPWQSGWIAEALVAAVPAGAAQAAAPPQTGQPGGLGAMQAATLTGRTGPAAWVSAGYSYMYDIDSELSFPLGIYVDGSVTLLGERSRSLGAVGEVTWARHDETVSGFTVNLTQTTFLGGVRLNAGSSYVQALAGIVRVSAGTSVVGFSISDSQGMLQAGGGVNARISDSTAIRFGADYRYSSGLNQVRVLVGVAFGLGGS